MAAQTVGTFEEFKRAVPEDLDPTREEAAKNYLDSGGIIKIDWPELVYPTSSRLETQIATLEAQHTEINTHIKEWREKYKKLKTDKMSDLVERIVNPLYWEHSAKLIADSDYRETFKLVEPPMHLINRKEWQKRLKLFIKSKEYRERLHEARTSQIGKKREGMRKEVEARLEFTRELARTEKQKLVKKRNDLQKKISSMQALLVWAKQNK